MPKPSVEQQKSRVVQIRKELVEKGDKLEAKELRDLKKKLRRAQRKHRHLTVEAGRRAKPEEKKAETKEEAAEEPAS